MSIHRNSVRGFAFAAALVPAAALPAGPAAAAADIAAGKATAAFACAECHGMNGIGVKAEFPNLAGQKELYLVTQLKAFKSGKRKFPVMNLMTRQLSDADIANVAAYFAGLPCTPIGAKK